MQVELAGKPSQHAPAHDKTDLLTCVFCSVRVELETGLCFYFVVTAQCFENSGYSYSLLTFSFFHKKVRLIKKKDQTGVISPTLPQ